MKTLLSLLAGLFSPVSTPKSLLLAGAVLGAVAASTPAAHAGAIAYTWGGGSNTWNTSTAHWSTNGSAPFTSIYSNSRLVVFNTAGGSVGTVTVGTNVSPSDVSFNVAGYTLALDAKTVTSSGTLSLLGATTFDFGGTTSAASFAETTDTWSGSLTVMNFVTGSSSLRFGTTSGGLSSTDLALITFSGYTNGGAAQINASGFVTPTGVLAIPEPSTYAALAGAGALGLALFRSRRRRVAA